MTRHHSVETYPAHPHDPMRPGPDCGFTGSVAVPPYTAENRAAHGCVVTTEVCRVCGAERRVNVNQLHEEYGPWGLCRAARERAARTAQAEADQAAMDRAGIRVVAVRRDAQGCVREILIERAAAIGGRTHAWHAWHEVAAAARQPDTGDGLVPIYRGTLRAAERAETVAVR